MSRIRDRLHSSAPSFLTRAAAHLIRGGFSVPATRNERIQHFDSHIYGHVEGWLGDRMSRFVDMLGALLEAHNVRGHLVELGVHHGLFLFLLNALRNDGEKCFAIDLFEEQQLNIDNSGCGSFQMFSSNLQKLLPEERPFFDIVKRDTTSFSIMEFVELLEGRRVKLISIDAGHTHQHAFNDLQLAQEVLAPGGIVALDDYMSVHWPGVTEGLYRFMQAANRRLKPFVYFQNKLFLTTISECEMWLRELSVEIEAIWGNEIRSGRWRSVEITGAKCLSFE